MAVSYDFIAALKDRINLEELISGYVPLKRSGSNYMGLCPFHGEKTPSFSVSPEKGFFHCFGCGVGGDMITFVMKIENLDYIETLKFLAGRAGVPFPDENVDDSYSRLRTRVYEINREAARYYFGRLTAEAGRPARQYLAERALTADTIRKFGLGYAPDAWQGLLDHMKGLGFEEDDLFEANLIAKSDKSGRYYDRFRHRVMFPIMDLRGNVIAFGGRVMPGQEGAKYINSSDTPVFKKRDNLFALNLAKNDKTPIILVEGYMDVIALHQAGFGSAVAALGTAFTQEQARLLLRYTPELVVTMDADSAGSKATDRVMDVCETVGLPVRVVRVPDGKDPDEFLCKPGGPDRFKALLEGASSDTDYRLIALKANFDLTATDGLAGYLRAAAEVLCRLDRITMELYAARLAETHHMDKSVILEECKRLRDKGFRKEQRQQINKSVSDSLRPSPVNPSERDHSKAAAAEQALLCLVINHPDWAGKAAQQLPSERMVTAFHRRLYERILDCYRTAGRFEFSMLAGDFSMSEMGRIVEISQKSQDVSRAQELLTDCIRVIEAEHEQMAAPKAGEMSIEEWNERMKQLREQKRKG